MTLHPDLNGEIFGYPRDAGPSIDMDDVLFESLWLLSDAFESRGYPRLALALEAVLDDFLQERWPASNPMMFRSRRAGPDDAVPPNAVVAVEQPTDVVVREQVDMSLRRVGHLPRSDMSSVMFPLARVVEIERFYRDGRVGTGRIKSTGRMISG